MAETKWLFHHQRAAREQGWQIWCDSKRNYFVGPSDAPLPLTQSGVEQAQALVQIGAERGDEVCIHALRFLLVQRSRARG